MEFTSRADGDLSVHHADPTLDERRRRLVDHPWSWMRQVHGSRVVRVTEPGGCAGEVADAAITTCAGAVLAVLTADCVPLAFVGEGIVGVAHVGWRGLMAGVVDKTVDVLRACAGDVELHAEIGPCIRARCYEFGSTDLDSVAERFGPEVRATSAAGRPALDLPAGITSALARLGVPPPVDSGVCTACSPAHWSFRAHAATERQALIAWLEPSTRPAPQ